MSKRRDSLASLPWVSIAIILMSLAIIFYLAALLL
jgi:hypothetical protein